MEQGAKEILRALDRHLAGPCAIRLMGGAALILGYGMERSTEDADLLLDDDEAAFLAEERDFGDALEKANRDLEPMGLYLSHIWGPEQQILTPAWRSSCRPLRLEDLKNLQVEVLGPLDLITSKLCRADAGDLADIRFLLSAESLSPDSVRRAMAEATVPQDFKDVYPANCSKVEQLLSADLPA